MRKIVVILMLLFVAALLVSCGQKNVKSDSGIATDIEDDKEEVNDAETNVADDKDVADVKEEVEKTKGTVSGIEGLSQKDLDELKEDFEAMKFEDINSLS